MLDGLRRLFATPSLESSGSKGRNYCTELEKAEEKGLPAEKPGVPRLVKVDGEYFTYRLDATFDPLKESSVREALDSYKAKKGFIVVRFRIGKGSSKREKPAGGRKPTKSGMYAMPTGQNLQSIAEMRCAKKH